MNLASGEYLAATQLKTQNPLCSCQDTKSKIVDNYEGGKEGGAPVAMKNHCARNRGRGQPRALNGSAALESPALVFHTQLEGKKNVFRVTRFSSGFTLFLGTGFIPSAKGTGVGVYKEVDSEMLADP